MVDPLRLFFRRFVCQFIRSELALVLVEIVKIVELEHDDWKRKCFFGLFRLEMSPRQFSKARAHIKQAQNSATSSKKPPNRGNRNKITVTNSIHGNQSIPSSVDHVVELVTFVPLLDNEDGDGKAECD